MKETLESFKTPLWLAGAVIAAWGAWIMRRRIKSKKSKKVDKTSDLY
jgi:hypothetical protein